MSVLIRPAGMNVNQPDGSTKQFDIVNFETTAQALAQIEAKKQQALDDIPDEYTVLAANVSLLSESITEISDVTLSRNLFYDTWLLVPGISRDTNGFYVGRASTIAAALTSAFAEHITFEPGRYALSFEGYVEDDGTNKIDGSSGLRLTIRYPNITGTTNLTLPNSSTLTRRGNASSTTNLQIESITASVGTWSSNVWHIRHVQLEKGNAVTDYVPPYTLSAVDSTARQAAVDNAQTIEKVENTVLSQTRRPSINFQFDDGNANDANIVNIFDTHGYRCGFALLSTVTDVQRYLGYQDNGYEILSHSVDGTGMNDPSVTLSVIEDKLARSKEILTEKGFRVRGWVTPNSRMALKFRPIVQKYYDWGADTYYGSYDGTGKPYAEGYDGCYNLWRVSLQTTSLENMKKAVDETIDHCGCLTFYGHAAALDTTDSLTTSNLNALLSYITSKGDACTVGTPGEVIPEYFRARSSDAVIDWIEYTTEDVNLDSRFSAVNWDMRYSPKLHLMLIACRLKATVDVAGIVELFDLPVSPIINGIVVPEEANRGTILYDGKMRLAKSGTWTANTSYRFAVTFATK